MIDLCVNKNVIYIIVDNKPIALYLHDSKITSL